MTADWTLRRVHAQFGIRHVDFRLRQRVGLVGIRVSGRPPRRPPWNSAKHKIRPGQICVRCLLEIEITLTLIARINLDGMISDGTCSAKTRNRRAARADSRNESNCSIIPIHDPGILHSPPAESFDAELDRRSDRTRKRSHFEALSDLDTVLRNSLTV